MSEYEFDVSLNTPLGERHGSMYVLSCGDDISGTLTLLKTPQDFTGRLEADGQCHIRGCLQSLKKLQSFTADGHLTESSFDLTLHLLYKDLHLKGYAKGGEKDGSR